MKVKTGDRVKFLNDTGSGVVVSLIDKNTALVRIEDDFEVPVLFSDLVVDAGNYYDDEEPEPEAPRNIQPAATSQAEVYRAEPEPGSLEDEEIVFILLPGKERTGFETYLANSSSYFLNYVITRQVEGEQVMFRSGILEPGLKVMLGKYTPSMIDAEESFRIQAIFYNERFFNYVKPIDRVVKIDTGSAYDSGTHQENDYFEENAILFALYDWKKIKNAAATPAIDPEEIKKAMFTKGDVKPPRPGKEQEKPEEVDLHIQHLVDNHAGLSNSEIMDIQLSRFRTSLETAMLHNTRRIVFIHGIGNGKLKHEIRKILDREYKQLRYQDASFKEYGYGATMVILN